MRGLSFNVQTLQPCWIHAVFTVATIRALLTPVIHSGASAPNEDEQVYDKGDCIVLNCTS